MSASLFSVALEVVPRHVHLSAAHLQTLFGAGYADHAWRTSRLRGQYAAKETVTVQGPDGEFAHVRVLGPCRKDTQVELSAPEAKALGIKIAPRLSGDLTASGSCVLIGPNGTVKLRRGVIVPLPHLHLSDTEAKKLSLKQGEAVVLRLRHAAVETFGPVYVRVHPTFRHVVHLTADDASGLWLTHESHAIIEPAADFR